MSAHNQQWVWRVRGLGGVLTMLEQLREDGCPCPRRRLDDLRRESRRLAALVALLESEGVPPAPDDD